MLAVPRNYFITKYEHYSSLTQALATLPLCIYADFVTLELKFSQPHGRPGVNGGRNKRLCCFSGKSKSSHSNYAVLLT